MNYIGSKQSLLPFLDECITQVAGDSAASPGFCDLFAGTGAVGRYFKKKGHCIVANDIQYYSYVLNRHYIQNSKPLKFNRLIPALSLEVKDKTPAEMVCAYLDTIPMKKGFIYHNYSQGDRAEGEDCRLYFSKENAAKCDAIRIQIEEWYSQSLITENEYFFLLTTLLENIDKVANTTSVYAAFLKKLKPSALKPFVMKPAELILSNWGQLALNEDANEVVDCFVTDILYLDPPYNRRQYSANYHLLETIALYDSPEIKGKTGIRPHDKQRSDFCYRAKVKKTFEEIISRAKARYIFLSFDDIREVMSRRGEYGCFEKPNSRYKADKPSNRHFKAKVTTEYLHYVKVKD